VNHPSPRWTALRIPHPPRAYPAASSARIKRLFYNAFADGSREAWLARPRGLDPTPRLFVGTREIRS